MLHLIKLSVGPKDIAELQRLQAARVASDPPLRHRTRIRPKRAAEILDGGSIYWVVAGLLRVRQRILDLAEDTYADGSTGCAIILAPELIPVVPRPTKPFQGWRYLDPDAAPLDIGHGPAQAEGIDALPPELRAALEELRLI